MAEEFDPQEFETFKSKAAAPQSGGGFDPAEFEAFKSGKPLTPSTLSAGEVATGALTNLGPSALQFGKDVAQPFLHPIETAENLKNLGHGVLQKTGILPGTEHEKYADAVGKFFADRYGGIENVKRTLATDPVGMASDLSVLLTGGGSLAAKLPATAGRVGEIAGTVGRVVDPINVAAKK